MEYSLTFYIGVKKDIIEAKNWYKEKQEGLDRRFSEAIKAAIEKIKNNPHAYAVRFNNLRVIAPKIFPYRVFYFIDETERKIVIVAVLHNKRNPDRAL